MASIEDVLTKVLERTREGKIAWKDTGVTNKFAATVGDSVIYVQDNEISRSLTVFNRKGLQMGRTEYIGHSIGEEPICELIELARNQALGVEKHLSGLMSALDRV